MNGGAFGGKKTVNNEHVAYLLGAPRKLMRLHVCRVMPLVLILLFSLRDETTGFWKNRKRKHIWRKRMQKTEESKIKSKSIPQGFII